MCNPKNPHTLGEVAYFSESAYITNDVVEALYELAETPEDKEKLSRLGFVKNAFEATAGTLSFAERKVNFTSIEKSLSFYEDDLSGSLSDEINTEKERYLGEVEAKITAKDWLGLALIAPAFSGRLSKLYADTMKNLFEVGKKTASDEIKTVSPPTDRDLPGVLRSQAFAQENYIQTQMATTTQTEVLYNIQRGATTEFTMQQVRKALDNKIAKMVRASGTQAMMGAFAGGRMSVFEKNKDKIYAFQYTAVLDSRTTRFCLSMNGRVVSMESADFFSFSPPNHVGCRSFWVEILADEFIKPAIEDIPDSIPRDRTGMTNFQDLQKIIPYKPKSAATPEETRKQREGVVRQLITDLSQK